MQRQRGELVPVWEVFSDLGGPVKAIREAGPPPQRGFTRFDQVNQLVGASEADPDRGFMARMMVLCSLPRSNPATGIGMSVATAPTRSFCTQAGNTSSPSGIYRA